MRTYLDRLKKILPSSRIKVGILKFFLISTVSKVDSLYKKHLLPGFDDRQHEERSIERLSDEIMLVSLFMIHVKLFQSCQKKIKKVHNESLDAQTSQGRVLGKNIQTSLATKLQDLSSTFRKTQSSYLSSMLD